MARKRDLITTLTAEIRCGHRAWRTIRPYITRYVLMDGSEFVDWTEIRALIERSARVEPPEDKAA
jgi:hypothetical protein